MSAAQQPGTRQWAAQAVLAAKRAKQVTWDDLAAAAGRSTVWTTSALLGQQALSAGEAAAVGEVLDLDQEVIAAFGLPPVRGAAETDLTEPVTYRLAEIVQVYGPALQQLIAERFGDGIMSAIDFELDLDRIEDPKGDRVKVTLNGKFLPYRVW